MNIRIFIILLFCACIPVGVYARLIPDSIWTVHQQAAHHHVTENEIWLSADRPGAGIGSEVLNRGYVQWETGFEAAHIPRLHSLNNLDFGLTYAVHPRVQLDTYAGFNLYNSLPAYSGPKNSVFVGFGVTWLIWHP